MKKFLITLLISGIIVAGVWIVPDLNKSLPAAESIEMSPEEIYQEELAQQEMAQRELLERQLNQALRLDTVAAPIQGGVVEQAVVEPPQMALMTEPKKETDWQALITWIIGSLNGIFGLAVMAKKVFGKSS